MEPKLLGVYESEKAIVRIYTGAMTETEEQRRELFSRAMLNYAKAIRKSNPELYRKITREVKT